MLCSVSYFISAGRCFCMLHYFVAMDGGAFVQPYALAKKTRAIFRESIPQRSARQAMPSR